MKHCSLIAFFFLLFSTASLVFAQVPQQFNYQGVARDNNGTELPNQSIGLQISLHSGSPSGTTVYQETHSTTTNQFGLFNLQIGTGNIVSGAFNTIDWGGNVYYVQTEMDASGGSNYTDMGTSQLLSVPYALYAETSSEALTGLVGPTGPQGPQGIQGPTGSGSCDYIKAGDGRIVIYSSNTAYGFGPSTNGYSNWYTKPLDGNIVGAIASDSIIVVYTSTAAYGFGPSANGYSNWYTKPLDGNPLGTEVASGRIVVYTATEAYGFGRSTNGYSNWYTTTLVSTPLGTISGGNRIVVFTSTEAYGFGPHTNGYSSWYTKTLDEIPVNGLGTR